MMTGASAPLATRPKRTALSAGGALIALGVVYGDIGTSPMYVLKAVIAQNGGMAAVSDELILGALSLVIWTLTLLTTVKYVLIARRADNRGEGGIFALYSLVRRYGGYLVIPAMVGGAALLADGMLTPAVTVTTAIEGLRTVGAARRFLGGEHVILLIVLAVITLLFLVQRAGTSRIGKAFGPVMGVWFLFLAAVGVYCIGGDWSVLRAFNPLRGLGLLFSPHNRAGLLILGSVFLATTGAEALYSDMGHVGRPNIYASWPRVKLCLLLCYLGQGSWLMAHKGDRQLWQMVDINPFFEMLPAALRPVAVVLGTLAAIIASQALITGSFTLVSEAINLDLMPHLKISYPAQTKGQMYIRTVNLLLWLGCVGTVLYFRSSARMEAAYGLAITLTMLMTTWLLGVYLRRRRRHRLGSAVFTLCFGCIEGAFFLSSLQKFSHGGYVALGLAAVILWVMAVWYKGTQIERSQAVQYPLTDYLETLRDLRGDTSLPLFCDNLVYITRSRPGDGVDRDILYSIFDRRPKWAAAYWLVSIAVTDEPYTRQYTVQSLGTDYLFRVQLQLGFKVHQQVNTYLRQIVTDLIESGELPPQGHRYSVYGRRQVGDFRFCILRKQLPAGCALPAVSQAVMACKYAIRRAAGTPIRWYGLENAATFIEYLPLFVSRRDQTRLTRARPGAAKQDTGTPVSMRA